MMPNMPLHYSILPSYFGWDWYESDGVNIIIVRYNPKFSPRSICETRGTLSRSEIWFFVKPLFVSCLVQCILLMEKEKLNWFSLIESISISSAMGRRTKDFSLVWKWKSTCAWNPLNAQTHPKKVHHSYRKICDSPYVGLSKGRT